MYGVRALQFDATWAPRPGYLVSEFERRTRKAVTGSSVWRNPRLDLIEAPEPALGPLDVRLRPRACGVCGSDVHFYETDADGYIRYPGLTRFPVVVGHEFSAEILEAGAGVRRIILSIGPAFRSALMPSGTRIARG